MRILTRHDANNTFGKEDFMPAIIENVYDVESFVWREKLGIVEVKDFGGNTHTLKGIKECVKI